MKHTFDDGRRAAAGWKGSTGDCVVRAAAIASDLPYQQIYDIVNQMGKEERTGRRKKGRSSARAGVYKKTTRRLMALLGFKWTPTMSIGSGCKVHLRDGEVLMKGRIIVNLSKHVCAVVDGVIHDLYDPSRAGTRCVYGYWSKE